MTDREVKWWMVATLAWLLMMLLMTLPACQPLECEVTRPHHTCMVEKWGDRRVRACEKFCGKGSGYTMVTHYDNWQDATICTCADGDQKVVY